MLTAGPARWLIGAITLAAGLGAGLVAGDLLRSDPVTTIVPIVYDEAVPIAFPVATGDDEPPAGTTDAEATPLAAAALVADDATGDGDGTTTTTAGSGTGGGGGGPEAVTADPPTRVHAFVEEAVAERPARLEDTCATLPGPWCPVGIPARVGPILNDTPPLDVLVAIRTADDPNVRCTLPMPDQPFDLPLLIMTTNPAALQIVYRLQPDDFGQILTDTVTLAAPDADDPERTRWEGLIDDGTSMLDRIPYEWVQTCVNLPRLASAPLVYTVDTTAADAFQHVATHSQGFVAPSFTDRPLPVFSVRSDHHLRVGVFVRQGATPRERAVVYPIEASAADATTCTAIEAAEIAGGFWPLGDITHPDPEIGRLVTRLEAITPTGTGQERYDWVFPLREGRRYTLCIFTLAEGARSFDPLSIVERVEYEVFTPNRYQVRITAVDLRVTDAKVTDRSFRAIALPWEGACRTTPADEPVPVTAAGTYRLDHPLCVSEGGYVQPLMPIELGWVDASGSGGSVRLMTIPIDPAAGCERTPDSPGCLGSRVEWYSQSIPGVAGIGGSLTVRVDYTRSNSQGRGAWVIGAVGLFADSGYRPPETGPRADEFTFSFEPVPDRVDALRVRFDADRPTRATVTIIGDVCTPGGGTATSTGFASSHDLIVEGLCPDTHYALTVHLEDQQGATVDLPNGWFARGYAKTNGYTSRVTASVIVIGPDPELVGNAAAVCREIDARYPATDIADDCWRWLDGAPSSRVTAGSTTLFDAEPIDCLGDAGQFFEAVPGTRVEHGATLRIVLELDPMLTPDCGAPARIPFDRLSRTFVVDMAQTLGGDAFGSATDRFSRHGLVWEVTISVVASVG